MLTTKPLVPQPKSFKIELVTEKLKRYKTLGIHQSPAQLIEAECNI